MTDQPRTAAGRALHESKHGAPNSRDPISCTDPDCPLVRKILAIEAEAAALDVERLWQTLEGMGVIANGTWVSFQHEDAEEIVTRLASADEEETDDHHHGPNITEAQHCPTCIKRGSISPVQP